MRGVRSTSPSGTGSLGRLPCRPARRLQAPGRGTRGQRRGQSRPAVMWGWAWGPRACGPPGDHSTQPWSAHCPLPCLGLSSSPSSLSTCCLHLGLPLCLSLAHVSPYFPSTSHPFSLPLSLFVPFSICLSLPVHLCVSLSLSLPISVSFSMSLFVSLCLPLSLCLCLLFRLSLSICLSPPVSLQVPNSGVGARSSVRGARGLRPARPRSAIAS